MTAANGPPLDADAPPAPPCRVASRLEGDATGPARAPTERGSPARKPPPPRTPMAQRRAHRAQRAERLLAVQQAGHASPGAAHPPASRQGGAGRSGVESPRSLADDVARLACELIASRTAGFDTEAFMSELLRSLRRARPDVDDRALAIALVQIRRHLLAFASAPVQAAPAEPDG